MTEASTTSFTDLLVNQPVLVWSLAGGISILVIAGFLSLFLSVRSRAQKKQANKDAAAEARLAEAERMQTAVAELKTISEDEEVEDKTAVSVAQAPIKKVTLEGTGEGGAETATFVQTGAGESEKPVGITEEKSHSSGGEESDLAALFSADVIVDPHLQAMRDNLPEIAIEALLKDTYAIKTQLQERIAAASAAAHG